jgi:hypothetical protein
MASLDFGDVPQHSCVQAHSSNSTTSTRVDLSHRLGAPSSASFFDSPESVGFGSQATEQRMYSVADLVPPRSEEIHERACRRAQKSTAVEFSAAAPMRANGMADGLAAAKNFRRSSCLRTNHCQHLDF